MAVEVKFCGLTRADDAGLAASLGARYAGVIFAGGPRSLTVERAAAVLRDLPEQIDRVGVFGDQADEEIGRAADMLQLAVVQLHGAHDRARITALRKVFRGQIWSVVRVSGASLPAELSTVLDLADGVLLDAFVPGALGGTGVALNWDRLAAELSVVRGRARIILAGGLKPENVRQALTAMHPDVVDVSSGVESAPGIKDHQRMRAFRDAVMQVPTPI